MGLAWIAWNLTLAAVPLVLSFPLFRVDRDPAGWRWWVGVAAFVAFLPNAPYVLTDVIHFTNEVRHTTSDLRVAFLVIPKYAVLFALGFLAYALSVARMEHWLRNRGWSFHRVLALDVGVHGICAVGVFIGRVFRFNSWDIVARPHDLLALVRIPKPSSVLLIAITFVVLAGGTAALRLANRIRVALDPHH
jgi:uncharacterized membrane protein